MTEVAPAGAASLAGLKAGDVIIEADRQAVASVAGLELVLDRLNLAEGVLLLVQRGASTFFAVLKR